MRLPPGLLLKLVALATEVSAARGATNNPRGAKEVKNVAIIGE